MTIRNRFIRGYALVLGIAFAGTVTGIGIGNHLQKKALKQQYAAIAERKLLKDLQLKILYNRPAKQLSPYLDQPNLLRAKNHALLGRIKAIQELVQEYWDLRRQQGLVQAPAHHQKLEKELIQYHIKLQAFRQRTQTFQVNTDTIYQQFAKLANEDLTDEEREEKDEQLNQELLSLVQSPEFANFVRFPEILGPYVQEANEQEKAAAIALEKASDLKSIIVLGSLVVSGAIAAVLAYFTSQAIAQPIQTVTAIARRVTEENNFDLQANIQSQDEIGSLAQSLNQLIAQVKQLLGQLETQNTDLESALHRVNQQQMQLVQAEKMSSLGKLVAGIAHEINNPVSFIHGNLSYVQSHTQELSELIQLYEEYYPNPHIDIQDKAEDMDVAFIQRDLEKLLGSMHTGTQRIREIVLSLRNFSRMDESEVKTVNIHDGLDSTVSLLHSRLAATAQRPAITIQKDYDTLPLVECAAGHLNQVFMNILSNAIEAFDEGISCKLPNWEAEETAMIWIRTKKLDNDAVQIEISDNGPGMSDAVQKSLFDPFFTTKPIGQGTGMGMSLSYQIITEGHGGKLECASTLGEGSTLMIQLPCKQADAGTATQQNTSTDNPPAPREVALT